MEYSAAASNVRPLALAYQHDLLRTASGDVHPAAYHSSGASHPPDVSAALRFRYYSGFGRPLCPAQIYYRLAAIQCEIYLYDSLCRCSQFVDAPNTISQVLFAVNASVFALRYCPLTARLRVHALNQ